MITAQAFAGSLKVTLPGLLQEARFDRHFVRDLTWSRHQLEELAERRFIAAQRATLHNSTALGADGYNGGPSPDTLTASFTDLFKKVCTVFCQRFCDGSSTARRNVLYIVSFNLKLDTLNASFTDLFKKVCTVCCWLQPEA